MFNPLKNLIWSKETTKILSKSDLEAETMLGSKVTVYQGTYNPTKSWDELKVKQRHFKKKLLPLDTPVYEDKVRFVCMSDTHNRTNRMPPEFVPPGDVYLNAGDFTMTGKVEEIEEFNKFLGTLPHKHKVVIAGNHDLTFDDDFLVPSNGLGGFFNVRPEAVKAYLQGKGLTRVSELLTNCTYIQDEEVTVAGVRIFGSPWQPEFGSWGFNLNRGQQLLDKWDQIPEGVDVLMTHGPPIGHGDEVKFGARAGCVELLNTIQKRVKPLYHIFGHIHEGYGVTSDGHTTYINASTCTLRYKPLNPPIIFDIPLKPGFTKDDITFAKSNRKQTNKPPKHQTDSAESGECIAGAAGCDLDLSGESEDSDNFICFEDDDNESKTNEATVNIDKARLKFLEEKRAKKEKFDDTQDTKDSDSDNFIYFEDDHHKTKNEQEVPALNLSADGDESDDFFGGISGSEESDNENDNLEQIDNLKPAGKNVQ